jgi:hypothetical protein
MRITRLLRGKAERSASQTNCNPILYLVALAAIIGGVAYHFRSAVLHAVELTVMCICIAFLLISSVHVAKHIIQWRKGRAHNHESAEDTAVEGPDEEYATKDPVGQAEEVLDAALEGLVIPPTQTPPRSVS